jgi:hypothetical protein
MFSVTTCSSINPSASTVFKTFPTAQPTGYLIFIQKNAPIHEKINISHKNMNIEIKFSQKYLKQYDERNYR